MRIGSLLGSHVTLMRSGVHVEGYEPPSDAWPSWETPPSDPHSYTARVDAAVRDIARSMTIPWDAVTGLTVSKHEWHWWHAIVEIAGALYRGEPKHADPDSETVDPWGVVTATVDTVDGPYRIVYRQRLFVRTTRRRAHEFERQAAAFIATPDARKFLPERDR